MFIEKLDGNVGLEDGQNLEWIDRLFSQDHLEL